jgi:hypothetical protein
MNKTKSVLITEREGSGNFYVKLLVEEYQRAGYQVVYDAHNFLFSNFEPSFVHIQWPETIYLGSNSSFNGSSIIPQLEKRFLWYKEKKIPIVHTVHNIEPHDLCDELDRRVFNCIVGNSDLIVHHGSVSIELVKNMYPASAKKKHIVCPHGPYPTIRWDNEDARHRMLIPLDKFVILNFGVQRANKGGEFVLNVFRQLKLASSYLLTVGKIRPARIPESYLKKAIVWFLLQMKMGLVRFDSFFAKNRKNICRAVSEDEVAQAFTASDVVFLGHTSGLNSGVLAMAASYKKPVVYPDIGNFKDQLSFWPLQEHYQVGDLQSAVSAIYKIKKKIEEKCELNNTEWLDKNSWKIHVQKVIENLPEII